MTTIQSAKTQYVEASGIKYAYRLVGGPLEGSIPLVCLQHFRGTMDRWDPALINALAKSYPIIIFDNAGVGRSTGEIPDSVAEMAKHVEKFVHALDLQQICLYGFSLGGMIAQQVVLDTIGSGLVKKVMLVGTSPGTGPATPQGLLEVPDIAGVQAESRQPITGASNMKKLFFFPSETSQAAGQDYWDRLESARTKDLTGEEPTGYIPLSAGLMNMATAGQKWATGEGALERLHEISEARIPTFISNGKSDYMLPTQHSWEMSKRMPNAWFFVYPDSGHGAGFQWADVHAKHVELFLKG